jgi:dihydrofolate reductase
MPSAPAPTPRIELVVATSDNDVIGVGNALPWRLPEDLKRFKSITMGHPILMGRKTYESIGKALPGRRNLVMSRSAQFAPADASVVVNLPAALEAAVDAPVLMVIGGSEIYAQTLPHAQRIHLTLVHTQIDGGEAFFRGWRGPQFRQADLEYHTADERHAYPFSFITLERS